MIPKNSQQKIIQEVNMSTKNQNSTHKTYRRTDLKKRLAKFTNMPELPGILEIIKQDPASEAPQYDTQLTRRSLPFFKAIEHCGPSQEDDDDEETTSTGRSPGRNNRVIPKSIPAILFLALILFFGFGLEVDAAAAGTAVNITLNVTRMSPDDRVSGTVTGINPDDVKVVVFARTNQWYIQPFADNRAYLTVNADGTYETWVRDWQQISAFVISKEYNALYEQEVYKPLPLNLADRAKVMAVVAYPSIHFSGYNWAVKAGSLLGPDDNFFSADSENVSVDAEGRLHLKITKRNGTWYCAEVYLLEPLGYGNYNFQFSNLGQIDTNTIGSAFIYQDAANELDIEFSRWGEEDAPNAQYVVQPYYRSGNRHRFYLNLSGNLSTHIIKWQEDYTATFQTLPGHYLNPPKNQIISQWNYSGTDVPMADNEELVHLNLWLLNGEAPANETGEELIIQSFTFYAPECTPPEAGDWLTTNPCTLFKQASISGNLYLEAEACLTIIQNASLTIE